MNWAIKDLRVAKQILKRYSVKDYRAALLEIGVAIDRDITPGAIRAAFARNKMGSPTMYCGKGTVYRQAAKKSTAHTCTSKARTIKPGEKLGLKQLDGSNLPGKVSKGRTIVVLGDTQIKEGVPTAHLSWMGRYIVDQLHDRQDVVIVHLGDHWDMPSLSSYDKNKKSMEGRRYKEDIAAGNKAFDLLCKPLEDFNKGKKPENQWWPERHFLLGNHENRIARATEDDAQLEGVLSFDDLNATTHGWTVHPFLERVWIGGVAFSHYFYNPNTGRPYCGENLHTRLKTISHSFVHGHQQGLSYAVRATGAGQQFGLVCGSSYLHDEKYLGPQGNGYWRGIVLLHQVESGSADPMMVSMDFLCRRYENMTLEDYMTKWREENS